MNGPSERSGEQAPTGPQQAARGERPFTEYGQFGVDMLDTRVLWQDQVWVDRLGTPHTLREMSNDYLTNVIAYLHRRAPEWHLDALLEAMADLANAESAAVGPTALSAALSRLEAVIALDPVRWIDQTPLVAALRRRLHACRERD